MAKEIKYVDITHNPVLLRITEQIRSTDEPLILRQEGEDVAIVRPIKRATKRRASRGRPTDANDPLWTLVGIGASEGPGDVATNKHQYLADAYADLHR